MYCERYAQLRRKDCCTYFNAAMLEELVLKELYEELKRRGNPGREKDNLEQFLKKMINSLEHICQDCERQYQELANKKGVLYTRYATGKISAEEYRRGADLMDEQMQELKQKQEEAEEKYEWAEEAGRRNQDDMKQIIRFSHLEDLTSEAVDAFIKKVILYGDKRVEIEWNFAEAANAFLGETT